MNDLSGNNILYVDDEVNNLNSFRAAMRRYYHVFTAESGEDALKIFNENDIQVIVTDQRMPNMTGVQFLQQLPEEPDNVRIILTGFRASLKTLYFSIN